MVDRLPDNTYSTGETRDAYVAESELGFFENLFLSLTRPFAYFWIYTMLCVLFTVVPMYITMIPYRFILHDRRKELIVFVYMFWFVVVFLTLPSYHAYQAMRNWFDHKLIVLNLNEREYGSQ